MQYVSLKLDWLQSSSLCQILYSIYNKLKSNNSACRVDASIDEAHISQLGQVLGLVQLGEDGLTGHSMYNTVKPML